MSLHRLKFYLSLIFLIPGVFRLAIGVQRLIWGTQYFRVINCHGTPSRLNANFERHLRFYAAFYEGATYQEFLDFVQGKRWNKKKPGLLVTFDDGLRSQFECALPIVEKYGFSACFMVPSGFIGRLPPIEQLPAYACIVTPDQQWPDDRHMVNQSELAKLSPRHGLASHTVNHTRMFPHLSIDDVRDEIARSKNELESASGRLISAFCWVGGEPQNYRADAMKEIVQAGYEFGFMTCSGPILPNNDPLQIHRCNIEAEDPVHLAMFQLSGIIDLLHLGRRRSVNDKTGQGLRSLSGPSK